MPDKNYVIKHLNPSITILTWHTAAMETHTALAQLEDDKMTVWASTQSPFGLREGIMRELSMPAEKVRVITPFVGGGFGGKGEYPAGDRGSKTCKNDWQARNADVDA